MNIRQKTRLIIFVSLFLLIIVILVTANAFERRIINASIDQQLSNAELINQQNAQAISQQLHAASQKLLILAQHPTLRASDIEIEANNACSQVLRDTLPQFKDQFSGLSYANKEGIFVCMSNPQLVGLDATKSEHIAKTLQQTDHYPMIGDITASVVNPSRNVLALTVPIFDDNDQFIGILGGGIYADEIKQNYLSNLESFKGQAHTIIIDTHGHIITDNQDILAPAMLLRDNQELLDPIAYRLVDQIINSSQIAEQNKYHYFANYIDTSFDQDWWIITYLDAQVLQQETSQLIAFSNFRGYTALASILIICIAAITLFWFFELSRSILEPLEKLSKLIESIGTKTFNANRNVQNIAQRQDEIGLFASSLQAASLALSNSYADLENQIDNRTSLLKQTTEKLENNLDITEQQNKQLENTKVAMLNVMEDLEEQKQQVELQLKRIELFKRAVDSAEDGIVITTPDYKIMYINNAWKKQTGYTFKEVKGANPELLRTDETPESEYIRMDKLLAEGKPFTSDKFINQRKDESRYPMQITIHPIKENGQISYYVGILTDITERKRVERSKNEFVSLASHQLRTPLSAINWYTEALLDQDFGKLNHKQLTYLKQIERASDRMVDMVDALLTVSRLELGTVSLKNEPVIITQIATQLEQDFHTVITQKQIRLQISIRKKLPVIKTDQRLLYIILQNVLGNAIKYSQPKGIVTLRIGLSNLKNQSHVKFVVHDNGLGIPIDEQNQVFQKLFRASNAQNSDTDGTGLGLYLSKLIVEQLGGTISFESSQNNGTTFTVLIPVNS